MQDAQGGADLLVGSAGVDRGSAIRAINRTETIVESKDESERLGGPLPLGTSIRNATAPGRGVQRRIKRVIDVVAAGCGLFLLSPLLVVVAVLVRLDSRGPALFKQRRIGLWGREFEIIKFRTMTEGAEKLRDKLLAQSIYADPRLFKVPSDPRVTRLGRLLRRTSLDELPQLWNVLRGEMSLVGPRPPLPNEVDLYEPTHFQRLDVPPGITGPWQVAGRNLITDFDRVFALEQAYIENWTLGRDLNILLRTIPAVVLMRGAH